MSAGRDRRPWSGAAEAASPAAPPRHDPTCPLCPGNPRGAGEGRNPEYTGPFVFANDYPALRPDLDLGPDLGPDQDQDQDPPAGPGAGLLRAEAVTGVCRVMCFGPRHDTHLAAMSGPQLRGVVDAWVEQARDLGRRWRWVQIFENRGVAMGASNPHPHGQVWASSVLPDEPAAEDVHQLDHLRRYGSRLLVDYAAAELAAGERVVAAHGGWLAVVPYWAVWPFETLLLPLRPTSGLTDLDDDGRAGLVGILRLLLAAYDGLFDVPFPYSMGWHSAPSGTSTPSGSGGPGGEGDPARADHWQLHAHFYPPLLRSASVRKFLVGYEMLAGPQRDITPEQAAARLRAQVPA